MIGRSGHSRRRARRLSRPLRRNFQRRARASRSPPHHHADHDAVTIVYTSGTSGEPKGVVLNAGNITFMLGCTNARLDQLMGARVEQESVFQYAPFCFAAARILLLTSLSRHSVLTLSTDLTKLADELKLAAPHYFVNVPMFLERVRRRDRGIDSEARRIRGRAFRRRAPDLWPTQRTTRTAAALLDSLWLAAQRMMFPRDSHEHRPESEGVDLRLGAAAVDTQLFFMMIGIPVLQVYGLTETTAICTMDDPGNVEPGRVGRAVPGIEMTVADDIGEILVRGPNVFPGYWQRPAETAKALEGGWFHTGDQGEADATGNWRITGRLKNLIILNSGHNVAPEPLEHAARSGAARGPAGGAARQSAQFLAALVTTRRDERRGRTGRKWR